MNIYFSSLRKLEMKPLSPISLRGKKQEPVELFLLIFLGSFLLRRFWSRLWRIDQEQCQLEDINAHHNQVLTLKDRKRFLQLSTGDLKCLFFQQITIMNPLLMMIPWRSQLNPTSVPETIMAKGMCRVHFVLKASRIPKIGIENKQYIIADKM